jgi:hypothetical protein
MVRNERLTLVERARHLAHAALATQQELDDLGAGRVAERFEERHEVADVAALGWIVWDFHIASFWRISLPQAV